MSAASVYPARLADAALACIAQARKAAVPAAAVVCN